MVLTFQSSLWRGVSVYVLTGPNPDRETSIEKQSSFPAFTALAFHSNLLLSGVDVLCLHMKTGINPDAFSCCLVKLTCVFVATSRGTRLPPRQSPGRHPVEFKDSSSVCVKFSFPCVFEWNGSACPPSGVWVCFLFCFFFVVFFSSTDKNMIYCDLVLTELRGYFVVRDTSYSTFCFHCFKLKARWTYCRKPNGFNLSIQVKIQEQRDLSIYGGRLNDVQ